MIHYDPWMEDQKNSVKQMPLDVVEILGIEYRA